MPNAQPDAQAAREFDAAADRDAAAPSRSGDAGQTSVPVDRDAAGDADAGREDAGHAPACTPTVVDDYCAHVPALPAAAMIDGVLDCGPTPLTLVPMAWNGASAIPAGQVTKLAIAWRADGLYVYVEVRGQVPAPHPAGTAIYCGDAVELYVDADGALDAAAGHYSTPGAMQFIVAAPSAAGATIEGMRYLEGTDHASWASDKVRTTLLADGYTLEAFITAADLDLTAWSPTASIGLDVAIDVSAPVGTANLRCGQLIGQYFLHVYDQADSCKDEPWCDSRAFCTPQL